MLDSCQKPCVEGWEGDLEWMWADAAVLPIPGLGWLAKSNPLRWSRLAPLALAEELRSKDQVRPVRVRVCGKLETQRKFDTPRAAAEWITDCHNVMKGTRSRVSYPSHWKNKQNPCRFKDAILVPAQDHSKFQELVDQTYCSTCTRDRPCPARPRCENSQAVAGGCRCARAGGTPGLPVRYRVCRVLRVEDSEMWNEYLARRHDIVQQRRSATMQQQRALTSSIVDVAPDLFTARLGDINEFVLFHGSNIRSCLKIAAEDIRLNLSTLGGGLGPGIYLADSITKADEYASDTAVPGGSNPDPYYQGIFAVLVMRVTMGKVHYREQFLAETEKRSFVANTIDSGRYDSSLVDRLKSAGTFKEFCVYSKDQIYTEYVVFYERVYANATFGLPRIRLRQPAETSREIHFQVPSYWVNFHQNPETESFDECPALRPRGFELLQLTIRLFSGRESLQLVEAVRLENSAMFCRYCGFKTMLQNRGQLSSRGLAMKLIMSGAQREAFRVAAMRNAFSLENIEDDINEIFLWAVVPPVEDGFPDIRQAAYCVQGRRELFRSPADALLETQLRTNNIMALFACRVLLGEISRSDDRGAPGVDSFVSMDDLAMKFRVRSGEHQIYPEMMALVFDPCADSGYTTHTS